MVREAGTVRWPDLYQNYRSGGWRGGSSEEHALLLLQRDPGLVPSGSQLSTPVPIICALLSLLELYIHCELRS